MGFWRQVRRLGPICRRAGNVPTQARRLRSADLRERAVPMSVWPVNTAGHRTHAFWLGPRGPAVAISGLIRSLAGRHPQAVYGAVAQKQPWLQSPSTKQTVMRGANVEGTSASTSGVDRPIPAHRFYPEPIPNV